MITTRKLIAALLLLVAPGILLAADPPANSTGAYQAGGAGEPKTTAPTPEVKADEASRTSLPEAVDPKATFRKEDGTGAPKTAVEPGTRGVSVP